MTRNLEMKPWVAKGIKMSSMKRDKLYREMVKTKKQSSKNTKA